MQDRRAYLPARPGGSKRESVADTMENDFRYSGNHFANEDLVTVMKPAYNSSRSKAKTFTTTIRIVPGKNPEVPDEWDVTRLSAGRGHFGDWIQCYWALRGGGQPSPVTFFLHPNRRDYNPRNNPAAVLFNAIDEACKTANPVEKSGWSAMTNTNTGESPVIKKPTKMYVAQCLVFEKGDTLYDPPKGFDDAEKIVLMDLGKDAGEAVMALVDARHPDGHGDPADPNSLYVLHDPIAFDEGAFFRIYPKTAPPAELGGRGPAPEAPGQARSLTRDAIRERQQSRRNDDRRDGRGGDARSDTGYLALAAADFNGYTPVITDLATSLYQKVRPWKEILYFPTPEEQAALLCEGLYLKGDLRLDVIEYAWADHPEWMPAKDSRIWGLWVGRVVEQGATIGPDPDDGDGRYGPPRQTRRADGPHAEPTPAPHLAASPPGLRRLGATAPAPQPAAADDGPPFDPDTPEAQAGAAKGDALAAKLARMSGARVGQTPAPAPAPEPAATAPRPLRRADAPHAEPTPAPHLAGPTPAPAADAAGEGDGFVDPPTHATADDLQARLARMRASRSKIAGSRTPQAQG